MAGDQLQLFCLLCCSFSSGEEGFSLQKELSLPTELETGQFLGATKKEFGTLVLSTRASGPVNK